MYEISDRPAGSEAIYTALQLVFTDDAQEPAFEMRHKLKLYSGEDTQGNQNPKKPVRETYAP